MFAFILNRQLNAVSIRAALSVALALSLVPTGTAQAELFWSHYRSGGWDDYGPPPQKKKKNIFAHNPIGGCCVAEID